MARSPRHGVAWRPRPEKGREGPFYEPLPLHVRPPSRTSAFPEDGASEEKRQASAPGLNC